MDTRDDRSEIAPRQGSRNGLDFVHGLLARPSAATLSLDRLLADLAQAFRAGGAGLAGPLGGENPLARRVAADGRPLPARRWPWDEDAGLLAQARHRPAALAVTVADVGRCLLTAAAAPDGSAWLFWLEGAGGSDEQAAGFTLAALALARWASAEPGRPLWARRLARAGAQHRLNEAALVTRRLAHDFGNILTGTLGFCELALNQTAAGSPLHRFLQEAHRAAQHGAELTRLLQLFGCRRAAPAGRPASLPVAAAEEAARLRAALPAGAEFRWDVPAELPPVAVGDDVLRTLLAQLLDNARTALAGRGTIALSARTARLGEGECAELLGSPEPGPCVEVRVADTGGGLSDEARRQLFVQPFFSTKPRHRGLGLAVVYGILNAHRGGFRIDSPPPAPGAGKRAEGRGTVVTLYLPLAAAPDPAPAVPSRGAGGGEKVLVVDDDPAVLHMIGLTLQGAGYRVETAGSAAQALGSYAAAAREPFHLVLSDVLMPQVNGFDLARQLLGHDANANVLFMSGHVSTELAQAHGVHWQFDLLFKPFRPETLLRAVRGALDRGSRRGPVGSGGPGEISVLHTPCKTP